MFLWDSSKIHSRSCKLLIPGVSCKALTEPVNFYDAPSEWKHAHTHTHTRAGKDSEAQPRGSSCGKAEDTLSVWLAQRYLRRCLFDICVWQRRDVALTGAAAQGFICSQSPLTTTHTPALWTRKTSVCARLRVSLAHFYLRLKQQANTAISTISWAVLMVRWLKH